MSKDLGNAIDNIMGTPKEINKNAIKYDNKNSCVIAIRFRKDDKAKLEKHFKLKGLLSTSQGIRQIIYRHMQDNNLI